MDDGAYEAEDESEDRNGRDNHAEFGPVYRGSVGNRDWGVQGQLFSEGPGIEATK